MKLGFTKKALLIIFIIGLIFVGLSFCGASFIKDLAYNQSLGLQSFLWQNGSEFSFNAQNQVNLNKYLIAENQKLLTSLSDLDQLKKENETLRNALSIGLADNYQLIMAEVTAKNNLSIKGVVYGDSLLINKGSKDGIKKGFPVVLANKIVLGKIIDVYPDFSRVLMISSNDSVIDVQIQDSPNFALAKGQSNQKIMLDMFPKGSDLKIGSLVMTSSLGGVYPSGLVVGSIGSINSVDSEAFKKAAITPAYDLNTLNKVFVIKNIIVTNE